MQDQRIRTAWPCLTLLGLSLLVLLASPGAHAQVDDAPLIVGEPPLILELVNHAQSRGRVYATPPRTFQVRATGGWQLRLDGVGLIAQGAGNKTIAWEDTLKKLKVPDGKYVAILEPFPLNQGVSSCRQEFNLDRTPPDLVCWKEEWDATGNYAIFRGMLVDFDSGPAMPIKLDCDVSEDLEVMGATISQDPDTRSICFETWVREKATPSAATSPGEVPAAPCAPSTAPE